MKEHSHDSTLTESGLYFLSVSPDIARASKISVNLPEILFQVDKSDFYSEFVAMKCAFLHILVKMMTEKRFFSVDRRSPSTP
ncbi:MULTISPECIES: hypothetical protein [Nitrosomonas]|uniref:hypothetical protein n=1 Tax=Nitrosomonas TaxID=914 RepID=UPI00130E7A88|nr:MULTISPECIES: hypothetical protein [Nitrosomonas]UVS60527.1 hypothetical protein NX761_13580 [Nitrosomonas sp. PLL12]